MTLTPESLHVCIVGAGAAGLSTACYLKDRGYQHITVLERESMPGGKCRTFFYQGRPYELGAVFGTPNYHATLGMMERAGVPPSLFTKQKKSRATKDLIGRRYYSFDTIIPDYFSYGEVIKLLGQILKYRKLAKNYRRLYFPGLDNISPELSDPFSRWVKKYGMQKFAKMIEIPCTTFGYGYFDEIPAAYVLKYMDVPNVTSLILRRNYFKWNDGAQTLWEKISKEFDVRYDIKITTITRADTVAVETTAGSLTCDALILTSPLDEALDFLDAASEEKELFSRIKYYDYYVYACVIEDFPIRSGFIPLNFRKHRKGHMMIWSCPWYENDLYLIYTLGDKATADEEIRRILRGEIEAVGGRLKDIHKFQRWKHFPHIDSESMKSGYYEKLESLQGKRNTYYAGELLSFSSIEHSVRYSQSLVERFF